jgi:hypothetical protein
MARKTSKTTVQTAEDAMGMIMATEPQKTINEAAQNVGCAEIRLLEMFTDKLGSAEPMGWELIPTEHEPLLDEFKNLVAAEASVRRFDAPTEPAAELPPVTEEILELPEELPLKKRGGRPKKESTALTQTKSSKLKESDQKAQQLANSDQQVKVALHARKGQKSGAQLATIELAAEDLTYRKIKGEALIRKVGQLTSEIAAESEFDPIQVLAELGIDSNSEIFDDLRQQIEPALGKLESATAEIVENAWVNGIDLGVELSQLENLLNSNDSTADYWQ